MNAIIISEANLKQSLSFDLRDILSESESYNERNWVAWKVDCFGSTWFKFFSEAPNQQVQMSYNELCDYATNVGQTIWGLFFVLKKDIAKAPILNEEVDLKQISDLIIAAHDATFFEVITDDKYILNRLEGKFEHTSFATFSAEKKLVYKNESFQAV